MKAISSGCCDRAGLAAKPIVRGCALGLIAAAGFGQFQGFSAASIEPPAPAAELTPGAVVEAPLAVRIRKGYHINSNRPLEDYLIPTKLSWDAAPLVVEAIDYPQAETIEPSFSTKPLAVYSSRIVIRTRFRVPAAGADLSELKGKFRFQACTDKACLPPRTIDVSVPVRR